jgi:hypothetical protein
VTLMAAFIEFIGSVTTVFDKYLIEVLTIGKRSSKPAGRIQEANNRRYYSAAVWLLFATLILGHFGAFQPASRDVSLPIYIAASIFLTVIARTVYAEGINKIARFAIQERTHSHVIWITALFLELGFALGFLAVTYASDGWGIFALSMTVYAVTLLKFMYPALSAQWVRGSREATVAAT